MQPAVRDQPPYTHIHEGETDYALCTSEDVLDSHYVFEVPKTLATDSTQAVELAKFILLHMGVAHEAGIKRGRRQAQRFFRLCMGVEKPTLSEAATWNNPVPLLQPKKGVR